MSFGLNHSVVAFEKSNLGNEEAHQILQDKNNIKFLKQKCNLLIDKALEIEQAIEAQKNIVNHLQEQKRVLEERLKKNPKQPDMQEFGVSDTLMLPAKVNAQNETVQTANYQDAAPTDVAAYERGEVSIPYSEYDLISPEKVLTMIQTLSMQLDNQPREEIVVRNLSTGAKAIEAFEGVIGKLVRVVLILGGMALVSLALTVIANQDLRNAVLELFKNSVGG